MKCGKLKGLKDLPKVYKAAVFESLESGQAGGSPELKFLAQKTTTDTSDVGADMAETVPSKKRMIGETYNNEAEVDNTDSKKKRGLKAVSTSGVGAPAVEPSQQLPTRRSNQIQGLDVGIVENDAGGVLAPEKKQGRESAASAATYPANTYSANTYPANTYPANTYSANTYPANTYPVNTYPANTYPANTFLANRYAVANPSTFNNTFPRPSQPDDFRDLDAESIAEVRRTIALNTPKTKPKRY